jgi:hypothetical protein
LWDVSTTLATLMGEIIDRITPQWWMVQVKKNCDDLWGLKKHFSYKRSIIVKYIS